MNPVFPFESLSDERRTLGLAVAVLIGIVFGFVLERAGFGRAQKLMGQFYGTDMTVLKVMFTGIVTAMLGTVILSGVGLLDLETVQFNFPTYLWPMILGGLLLGAGFVTSGYCPGTSVVATASGKLDALATVGGVVAGGVLYAELEPAMGGFPNSGKLGTFTIPEWLGLPAPVAAILVVALALGAFVIAERVERRVNRQAEPASVPPVRRWVFTAIVALAVVAALTLAIPAGTHAGQP
ncbi:MAG TPA: YeeE/YedE thiosulfate transporter family protein [Anaeromyxobacteraceae bacterium]|nr:YeeE/YedE thiosulfate transporter family protein [Anaeromyxobacteraceae bacterium]